MAEYEVNAHLDGEIDIEIDFSKWSNKKRLDLIFLILTGDKHTFNDVYVELEGETNVEIEPQDRY
jgi:hypothetical protein